MKIKVLCIGLILCFLVGCECGQEKSLDQKIDEIGYEVCGKGKVKNTTIHDNGYTIKCYSGLEKYVSKYRPKKSV